MSGPPHVEQEDPVLAEVARQLSALTEMRLVLLLRELADEKRIREIDPRRLQISDDTPREIGREMVRRHLRTLEQAGFATAERRPEGDIWRFEPSGLYALTENLRSFLVPRRAASSKETVAASGFTLTSDARGPRLVLLHGAQPGRVFALGEKARSRNGAWLLGRAAEAAVSLEYDGAVSKEHAEITRDGDGLLLEDLRSSRNGTYVNWVKLPHRGHAELHHGDIVGVGQSLLLVALDT